MHGGAGGIMSVGLMRAVSFDFMEMCVKSLYSTGRLLLGLLTPFLAIVMTHYFERVTLM